jgi:predicted ATPase/class 3 adenylate cyclase
MGTSPQPLPTGTVTFLFTDIEGSTRLLQELGEAYGQVQDEHAAILRTSISEGEGREIRTEGDSFFVAFPTALGALRAAVAAQRELHAHDWPPGRPLRVRMGIHSGEGRLGGDDYMTIDVNRAARVAAAGHGGQVLLSDATRALVAQDLPEDVGLRDLGERRLKDLALPIRIFQLHIAGLPDEFPELETLDARPTNLPSRLTSFVGRERDLARVKDLMEEHRLVTLTGTGGSGKTRLAVEVAGELLGEFPDGAFFVELAPVRDPSLVPPTLARALGVVDQGGDALEAVRARLSERELLLLLDNFEQVLEAAGMIEDLLSTAQRLRILVTSRTALGIYGEQEYEVLPFEVPDPDRAPEELSSYEAVVLFVDRARALKPDFELTDDGARAVAGITARLDGLPLAIELAASRLRVLTPEAMLSRLDQRLPLLVGAAKGRPERQRTLRGAIDWSYDLLPEPERRLFARLSVFPGGCSLQAAEAVCDPGDLAKPVLDGLEALVEKNLLRRIEPRDGEPRFGMLETILEYAGERLGDEFDPDATQRRLAEFLMAFAEEAEAHLTTQDQARWLDRCEQERANLRASIVWAIDSGEAEIGLRIAAALWRFWQLRGPLWEGRRALDELLALEGSSPRVRARAHTAAGGLAWWGTDLPATELHHEEALRLFRESGDRRGEVEGLYNVAALRLTSAFLSGGSGVDAAEDLFRQSLVLAEDLKDGKGIAKAYRGLGLVAGMGRGDPGAAVPLFEKAVTLFEEVGERWELNEALIGLGNAYRFLGDKKRAKAYYLRGLDVMMSAGNRPVGTGLLFLLCALEGEMGRHDRGARLWGAAEAAREINGALSPPVARVLIGDPLTAARQAIGDTAVNQAMAEGRAMDLDAAIAYAHEDL